MKRWDLYDDGLGPRDNGGWVLYEDHVSELATLTAERDKQKNQLGSFRAQREKWISEVNSLRKERDALRKQVESRIADLQTVVDHPSRLMASEARTSQNELRWVLSLLSTEAAAIAAQTGKDGET